MFDVTVNGPLAHVKRSLKVSPSGPYERTESPMDDDESPTGVTSFYCFVFWPYSRPSGSRI